MRLKQRRTITTKLDTGESAIWKEWQEMADIQTPFPKKSPENLPAEQVSPHKQKPKAIRRRHALFFAGLRR